MKKSIILFATLMVCIAVALCVSCSKDDDKSNGGGTSSNSIVGIWKGNIDDEVDVVLNVYNDNTGTVTVTLTEEDYYYGGYDSEKYDLTYKMTDDDKGYAIIEFDSYYYGTEYQRVDFELNGKIMYVYSNDEYYGNELICVLHKQ